MVYGTSTYFQKGNTTSTYDVNGNVIYVEDKFGQDKNRSFEVNTQGHILQKTENGESQHYYYVNGNPIGSAGELTDADFDYNYTPVSESYPGTIPGSHVVTAGDTLQSIALAVFGDSKLWYLIADANGISSDSDLKVGKSLIIPNNVTNIHNSYDTFKPYDPKEIIGDTRPTLPDPPPKKSGGGGCGGIGRLIVSVVSFVVANLIAPGAGGTFLQHFFAAAVGNMAGQVVGMAIGVQDGFNWGAVAAAGLSAGIMKGTTFGQNITKMAGSTEIGQAMLGGAAQNIIGQGINIVTGQQDRFDWAGVAVAAIAAPITNNINAAIVGPGKLFEKGTFGGDLAGGLVGGAVSQGTRILVTGKGKMQWGQIAADAFGNAIGNSIVRSLKPQPVAPVVQKKQVAAQGQAGNGLVCAGDLIGEDNLIVYEQMMRMSNNSDLSWLIANSDNPYGVYSMLAAGESNGHGYDYPDKPSLNFSMEQLQAYNAAIEEGYGLGKAYEMALVADIKRQTDNLAYSVKLSGLDTLAGIKSYRRYEVLSAALMSYDSYHKESFKYVLPEGVSRVKSDSELHQVGLTHEMLDQNHVNGYFAALYKDENRVSFIDGEPHYVLANRGTEANEPISNFMALYRDMESNTVNAMSSLAGQYDQAVIIAKILISNTRGNVTFTGHSLGGGLASLQAVSTRQPAITFNAAGVSDELLRKLEISADPSRYVDAYYLKGDGLSAIQGAGYLKIPRPIQSGGGHVRTNVDLPEAIGNRYELRAFAPQIEKSVNSIRSTKIGYFQSHYMVTFILSTQGNFGVGGL